MDDADLLEYLETAQEFLEFRNEIEMETKNQSAVDFSHDNTTVLTEDMVHRQDMLSDDENQMDLDEAHNQKEIDEFDLMQQPFYFESVNPVLRRNQDYRKCLRTLVLLEAQLVQNTKDLDELVLLEKKALDDPLEFFKKLKRGEIEAPLPIKVAEIPDIDMSKYNAEIPNDLLDLMNNTENGNTGPDSKENVTDSYSADTKNKYWTTEEQRRLEELLMEYPPEQYEMRRFAKIAKALGNRTTKQVASRLQKYFLKLHKAGLPIPGRIPKMAYKQRNKVTSMHSMASSTFFPSFDIPAGLDCVKEDDASNVVLQHAFREDSDAFKVKEEIVDDGKDMDIFDYSNFTPEHAMLTLLERVKNDKEKNPNDGDSTHDGYTCDFCSATPIIGTRWHCSDCTESVDYCTDCIVAQLDDPNTTHPLNHKLIALRRNENTYHCNQGQKTSERRPATYNISENIVIKQEKNDDGVIDDIKEESQSGDPCDDENFAYIEEVTEENQNEDVTDIFGDPQLSCNYSNTEYFMDAVNLDTEGYSEVVTTEEIVEDNAEYIDLEDGVIHVEDDDDNEEDEEECTITNQNYLQNQSVYDVDYLSHNFFSKNGREYNYLDPNFLPE